ncbi:hypothetical protein BBP40_005725 [Aspergillus hancockii]|nr:hypothetical protein BBP40_005725 [Aspergillus hancockii]
MAACRALTAFFISPAAAIGSAVVVEPFFKKERVRYMGIWTLMVTLGPLIFGFAADRAGYRWIFWVLAITNGVQVILAKNPNVMIPAVVYSMVFLFGSVLVTVEAPQLLQEKFGLYAEQLDLQFLDVIIGTVLGEQIGGSMSDYWMNRRVQRIRKAPEPEFRLWLSYFGTILTIVGVIIFLVCTQQDGGHWVVSPIVGTAIAAFGNQFVTTVMVTYAMWGFIGPFWFPDMFENVGVAASSGVSSALMFVFSLLLTVVVHAMGRKWRSPN